MNNNKYCLKTLVRNMDGVEKHIQLRHITHCYKADPAYGQGVADALGIPWSEVEAAARFEAK